MAFLRLLISIYLSTVLISAEESVGPVSCDYSLVQTMPENLTYKNDINFQPAKTHEVYLDLINRAQRKIQVATFYVTLTPAQEKFKNLPSAQPGLAVLEALLAARSRNVDVEFVISHLPFSNEEDLTKLKDAGVSIQVLNNTALFGDGVMHSKFIITDEENFYVGSANWDWRSLAQVKEFGISFRNCQALTSDISKIFATYQLMSDRTDLPEVPSDLKTHITRLSPLMMSLDGIRSSVYMGINPKAFIGHDDPRSTDLETILDTIDRARKYIYVSVMTFSPILGFRNKIYWPVIENALRKAAMERRVNVKLLVADKSLWFDVMMWYKSMNALCSEDQRVGCIEVRFFKVPTEDPIIREIPHARVKHDKYVVTDRSVYIGTSNWDPGYFHDTAGVGISVTPEWPDIAQSQRNILTDMKAIFERDYYSEHIVQKF